MIKESAFLMGSYPPGQAPRNAIRLRDGLVVIGAALGGLGALHAPAAVPAAIEVPLAAVLTCTLPAAVKRKPGGD